MIKDILDNDILYARIIRASYVNEKDEFFTRVEDELQLGIVSYDADYKTGTHFHNRPEGFINETDEILIIKEGSCRVDFYNDKGVYLKSSEVFRGDIIIIYLGGHNITYLEKSRVLMIKKGPYNPDNDKTRIVGANNLEIVIEN